MIVSLNDLQEEGGSVLDWFSEDLQKVPLVIEVHQDLQLLNSTGNESLD